MIASLIESGHADIAGRLLCCQHDRLNRQPGCYPWRCRAPGCAACRRTLARRWWQAFDAWITRSETSLAIIPVVCDPISAARKLRKSLRDVRDRAARRDCRWRAVAMAGLVDGDRALILLQHPGIDWMRLWTVLERRSPDVVLTNPGSVEPTSALTVEAAAALARRRRGIEPVRIIVLPQVIAPAVGQDHWDEPMPMLL